MIRHVFKIPDAATVDDVDAMFAFLRAPQNSAMLVDFEGGKLLVLVDETDDYDLLGCLRRIFPDADAPDGPCQWVNDEDADLLAQGGGDDAAKHTREDQP